MTAMDDYYCIVPGIIENIGQNRFCNWISIFIAKNKLVMLCFIKSIIECIIFLTKYTFFNMSNSELTQCF